MMDLGVCGSNVPIHATEVETASWNFTEKLPEVVPRMRNPVYASDAENPSGLSPLPQEEHMLPRRHRLAFSITPIVFDGLACSLD